MLLIIIAYSLMKAKQKKEGLLEKSQRALVIIETAKEISGYLLVVSESQFRLEHRALHIL